jgi:hypothetical protein
VYSIKLKVRGLYSKVVEGDTHAHFIRGHINSLSVPDYIIISIFFIPAGKKLFDGADTKVQPFNVSFCGEENLPLIIKSISNHPDELHPAL